MPPQEAANEPVTVGLLGVRRSWTYKQELPTENYKLGRWFGKHHNGNCTGLFCKLCHRFFNVWHVSGTVWSRDRFLSPVCNHAFCDIKQPAGYDFFLHIVHTICIYTLLTVFDQIAASINCCISVQHYVLCQNCLSTLLLCCLGIHMTINYLVKQAT